jgi:MYXO-CTERM domain-containing protein
MRRNVTVAVVQLVAVVQIFIAAGLAHAQMKVACVGDSITAPATGWCSALGTALGSGYTTKTFGVSGTTLLKNVGQPAFSSSAQYKPSHDYAPNIVVIMLGTNDSATRNWSAGKDHFVKDYEELIDSYTSLASKPTVFLNTPPPASDDNMFTISGTTIEKEINPLIKQVAMTKMCPLVDIWAAFDGDVEKIGSFDGVHPGSAGQMLIGQTVAKAIMSPMVPGGSAGASGSAAAGSGTSAGAGGGGQAGASATAGAGGGGQAGAGTSTAAGTGGTAGAAAAGTGAVTGAKAGSGAITGASGSSGGTNAPAMPGAAGAGGSATTAGNTGTAVNPVSAAGASAPVTSDSDSGCNVRAPGSTTSERGSVAALLLLVGIVIRSRRRRHS